MFLLRALLIVVFCSFVVSSLQRAVLIPALGGRDLIARAKTGTGKTLAFGIPMIKQLMEQDDGRSTRYPFIFLYRFHWSRLIITGTLTAPFTFLQARSYSSGSGSSTYQRVSQTSREGNKGISTQAWHGVCLWRCLV
jgi:hypothetical protein